jgi:heat shock protein HslJ
MLRPPVLQIGGEDSAAHGMRQPRPRICERQGLWQNAPGLLARQSQKLPNAAGDSWPVLIGVFMGLLSVSRRRFAPMGVLAIAVFAVATLSEIQAQGQQGFPFDRELRMDARPLKGSKRVPFLEIAQNGAATIDLWCDSVQGQFVVAADTVTVLIGQKTQRSCTPEQAQADGELISALEQATNWRSEGEGVVLTGGRELRFRPSTN